MPPTCPSVGMLMHIVNSYLNVVKGILSNCEFHTILIKLSLASVIYGLISMFKYEFLLLLRIISIDLL